MTRKIPVGIDLGTTFSAVATLDAAGRSAMVENIEGDLLTPSIVLFSEAEVVVGRDARNATFINPDLVAEWVKRDMGAAHYSRPIHGQYLPPEVIQGCILRKLRSDIVRALGPDVRCVITVPAYFDEPRRKATADAGEMAGLEVLDIVNEPTAAALVFGEAKGYLSPGGTPKDDMTVLIYDLGGGTFDSTLLRFEQGNITTIATDGDVQLGGHDWDMRMLNYLADQFQRQHGCDPRQSNVAVSRLLNSVIEAKHTLSAREHAMVRIDYRNQIGEYPVTRQLFASLTADLLDRTAYTTRQLLADARLEWKDIDRVLLVGGSTRMPMVSQMLRQLSGKEPDRTVNPDEAVARGAALYASYLLAKDDSGGKTSFAVTNVNSHSLGVEGIEPSTMRKTNVILIPRNTPLPARITERFTTKTVNQRSIVVQVLEGESSLPGECTVVGRTVVRDLPEGLPQGWPVEVTFEYAENGRLGVRASVTGTHQSAVLDLERTVGFNSAGIERWKQPITSAAGFDAFEAMVQSSLGLGGAPIPQPAALLATPPQIQSAPRSAAQPAAPLALPPLVQPVSQSVAQPVPPPVVQPIAPQVMVQPVPLPELPSLPVPPSLAAPPPLPPQPTAQGGPQAPSMAGPTINRIESEKASGIRWALRILGYVSSAAVGLGLGYLLLLKLRPELLKSLW